MPEDSVDIISDEVSDEVNIIPKSMYTSIAAKKYRVPLKFGDRPCQLPLSSLYYAQVSYTSSPVRLEAFHILHQSWAFEIAYNFIRPLINENVKDRIIFHGDDLEGLHAHIDPKCLPKRYGGVHEDYSVDMWFECIKQNDHIIKNLIDLGYKDMEKLKEE
ncbi:hypothetical protein NQ318_002769 [Aromia moschata]|uniref:CRAL-TRIO domain-containing protein n=1 Tax=Aromia moschata TaxID=1265417 RepID=A0AAV8X5C3_9CUCU|nr:hypothetical protein NQ318_002769 [Aromia moschata]